MLALLGTLPRVSHVRYRLARPLDRFDPYAFLAGWAVIFTTPLPGFWTWAWLFFGKYIAFSIRARSRSRSCPWTTGSRASSERVRMLATQFVDPAFSKLLEAVAADASVEPLATLLEAVAASAPPK